MRALVSLTNVVVRLPPAVGKMTQVVRIVQPKQRTGVAEHVDHSHSAQHEWRCQYQFSGVEPVHIDVLL